LLDACAFLWLPIFFLNPPKQLFKRQFASHVHLLPLYTPQKDERWGPPKEYSESKSSCVPPERHHIVLGSRGPLDFEDHCPPCSVGTSLVLLCALRKSSDFLDLHDIFLLSQAIEEDCGARLEAASAHGAETGALKEELADAQAELALLVESHDPETLQIATEHPTPHVQAGPASEERSSIGLDASLEAEPVTAAGNLSDMQVQDVAALLPATSGAGIMWPSFCQTLHVCSTGQQPSRQSRGGNAGDLSPSALSLMCKSRAGHVCCRGQWHRRNRAGALHDCDCVACRGTGVGHTP